MGVAVPPHAESPDAVAALDRVVRSQVFAKAERASQLLRFVVGKSLAGKTDEIKESTIALEVFGRTGYDPKIDSVVRVEAHKLRALLAKYYQEEGAADPIRIEIPRGNYVPVFHVTAPESTPAQPVRRPLPAGLMVSAAFLLIIAAAWFLTSPKPVPAPTGPLALAVLPFDDLSPAGDQRVLCDGLTEELIDTLSAAEGFRVVARTAVEQYRGKQADLRHIANELNVQAVLKGSVRLEGDRILISAQLVQADDGFQLWTQHFDRAFQEVLDIQQEIAQSVAYSFHKDLRTTTQALLRPRTQSATAWHYYLRAMALGDEPEGCDPALVFLRAALAADPNYAMAWARVAQIETGCAEWGVAEPRDALARAEQSIQRAIELDSTLAEAHHFAAKVKAFYHHDWSGAEASFLRAIESNPSNTDVRYDLAHLVLIPRARFEDAVVQLERGLAIEPRNINLLNELANAHIKSGQFAKALATLERSRQLNFGSPSAVVFGGIAAAAQGQYDAAMAHYEQAATLYRSNWVLGHMGYALAKMGRREQAAAVLQEMQKTSAAKRPPYVDLAAVHLALGDRESALAQLVQAEANLNPQLLWLKVDFRLEPLRTDPRFLSLLKRMHL